MKIHSAELNHVRQIRKAVLDLSAPLTVIGGPQGVGKSTVQEAILAAMFEIDRGKRESLKSRFDPDSPPTARLVLSRGDGSTPITFVRTLTDNTGEWLEGVTVIRHKGAAIAKIQETLPISADAAAMLLWGLQEEMAKVVTDFPTDGHTLLTGATICGAGPDPKEVIDELAGEIAKAKKKGQNQGPLTQAQNKVEKLEAELGSAKIAQSNLKVLQQKFDTAKATAEDAEKRGDSVEKEGKKLGKLEALLDGAIRATDKLVQMEKTQIEWDGLDEEIAKAERSLKSLREELDVLEAQYRVAKDKELADKIGKLEGQIRAIEAAAKSCDALDKELKAKRRPNENEQEERCVLMERIRKATDQVEASGVRYELSVESGTKRVKVSEDNAVAKDVQLSAGRTHDGVVGNVVIVSETLRVVASGKLDVINLKRSIERAKADIALLLKKIGAKDEGEFGHLLNERNQLEDDLKKVEAQLERELKGSTLASLKSELDSAKDAREDVRVTQRDKDQFAARPLSPAIEIEKKLARKGVEIEIAEKGLKTLSSKQPTEGQKTKCKSDLKEARKQVEITIGAFKDADEDQREPTDELLCEIKGALDEKRDEFRRLTTAQKSAQIVFTQLSTELKHAGPERPFASVESDLQEARAVLCREEVLQEARESLRQRVEQKITEMAASVPRELSDKVSEHLSKISKGAYVKVNLTDQLTVSGVRELGDTPAQWQPRELSCGERHQAALAVKIAVARALAETSGPVFMILDDSLVSFDPERRAAAENLLMDLVADGKIQVILLTCHTDWALDWKKRAGDSLNYIELAKITDYYRPPPAMSTATN